MGIVVLVFSLIAFFAVSVGPAKMGFHDSTVRNADRFVSSRPLVTPPARRSVIVDSDGFAHRTADGTQMTKRDRSKLLPSTPRTFEYKLPSTAHTPPLMESGPIPPEALMPKPIEAPKPVVEPTPTLDVVTQPETKTVEDLSVPMMSAEEVVPPAPDPVLNQKLVDGIVEADPDISDWARTTLRGSFREGLLILYGVAKDEKEKQVIGELAKKQPDVQTVENQLHTLDLDVAAKV